MIVLPTDHIGLLQWAASLIVDFPNDVVPILYTEDNWQDWAASLIVQPSFNAVGAPSPYLFGEWREWAQALVRSLGANA